MGLIWRSAAHRPQPIDGAIPQMLDQTSAASERSLHVRHGDSQGSAPSYDRDMSKLTYRLALVLVAGHRAGGMCTSGQSVDAHREFCLDVEPAGVGTGVGSCHSSADLDVLQRPGARRHRSKTDPGRRRRTAQYRMVGNGRHRRSAAAPDRRGRHVWLLVLRRISRRPWRTRRADGFL